MLGTETPGAPPTLTLNADLNLKPNCSHADCPAAF